MSLPPDEKTWYCLHSPVGDFWITDDELEEIAPWEDMTWD